MQLYPIPERTHTLMESLAAGIGVSPGFCPVCNHYTFFTGWNGHQLLRETGVCRRCNARNRQRQLAFVANSIFHRDPRYRYFNANKLSIYNLESHGSLHQQLSQNPNYVSSEFFGQEHTSGTILNGVRHEDAQNLSFDDAFFDLVVSSDVWEHIPDPYCAHAEIFRVLRPGGHHLFTVPFYQADFLDETRASIDPASGIVYHEEPLYHLDPLRPEGVLVFKIFSIEMLPQLARIGFHTKMNKLYSPFHGIFGNNAIVFDAVKCA